MGNWEYLEGQLCTLSYHLLTAKIKVQWFSCSVCILGLRSQMLSPHLHDLISFQMPGVGAKQAEMKQSHIMKKTRHHMVGLTCRQSGLFRKGPAFLSVTPEHDWGKTPATHYAETAQWSVLPEWFHQLHWTDEKYINKAVCHKLFSP